MKIIKNGSTGVLKEEIKENFTGEVYLDKLFGADKPSNVSVGHVNFMPGGRTKWHSHPLGQTLIITSGKGYIQLENEEKQEMNAGDIVWIAPHEKHWHGATESTFMSHIAIQEEQDGTNVTWMESVSDEDFTK